MLNPQLIKAALVKLAQFQNRPPYDVCVIRDVIANFNNHPLREGVLYFCEVTPKEYIARLAELERICRTKVMIELATVKSGIDVKAILDGELNITNAAWSKLQSVFDALDDAHENRDKMKDEFEYECQFDLFLATYVKECGFSWAKKKYTGENSDIVNEAWLSFQDFKRSRK